jgi:hypothetical protein
MRSPLGVAKDYPAKSRVDGGVAIQHSPATGVLDDRPNTVLNT